MRIWHTGVFLSAFASERTTDGFVHACMCAREHVRGEILSSGVEGENSILTALLHSQHRSNKMKDVRCLLCLTAVSCLQTRSGRCCSKGPTCWLWQWERDYTPVWVLTAPSSEVRNQNTPSPSIRLESHGTLETDKNFRVWIFENWSSLCPTPPKYCWSPRRHWIQNWAVQLWTTKATLWNYKPDYYRQGRP